MSGWGAGFRGFAPRGLPCPNGLLTDHYLPPGLLADRPLPSVRTFGRYYHATDYQGGALFLSDGQQWYQVASGINGAGYIADSKGHPATEGSTPTIVGGAGIGVGGSVSIASGDDVHGIVTAAGGIGAGTNATVATISYIQPYDEIPFAVQLTPANANAALLSGANMVFVSPPGNVNNWSITSGTTALANLTYQWAYAVLA